MPDLQWRNQTLYLGIGDPTDVEDSEPMKSHSTIQEGLKIRMSYDDPTSGLVWMDCPLSLHKLRMEQGKLTFTLTPVSGCSGDLNRVPIQRAARLGLINEMSVPVHYLEGVLITTDEGTTLERPEDRTYQARIDLAGVISAIHTEIHGNE